MRLNRKWFCVIYGVHILEMVFSCFPHFFLFVWLDDSLLILSSLVCARLCVCDGFLNLVKETENLLHVPVVCVSFAQNSRKNKRRRPRRDDERGHKKTHSKRKDQKEMGNARTQTNTHRVRNNAIDCMFVYGTCKIANRSTGLSH